MSKLPQRIIRFFARPVQAEYMLFFCLMALLVQQPIEWMFLYSSDRWLQLWRFVQGIGIEVGVAWLAAWLVTITGSRMLRWLFLLVAWLLMSITVFLVISFDMCISQQTITVLVETTPGESSEFLSTYALTGKAWLSYMVSLLALGAVAALNHWRGPIRARIARLGVTRVLRCVSAVVAALGVAAALVAWVWLATCTNSSRIYRWRQQYPPLSLDIATQSAHAVASLLAFANDVDMAIEQARAVYRTHPTVQDPGDELTVVYVLGESYIKSHASLYGYPLRTTPRMDAERDRGNLWAFTNVVAQENMTSVVEKNTFSINSMAHGESWFEMPNFTTVFRRAGYDVWMWDIQRDFMTRKLFTITVNSYIYNDEIQRLSYTQACDRHQRYDEQLLRDFDSHVTFMRPHNLVVFHLMGQHVDPARRYPAGSRWDGHFTADSVARFRHEKWLTPDKLKAIANYDNATLYNDHVMGLLFDRYRDSNAVIVMIADHGEEMYDWRNSKGRHSELKPKPAALKCQYQVPLVVWCSPRYRQLHPATVQRIACSVDRPWMTDNVGQLLFSLGGVHTSYYRPQRDVISPSFVPMRRVLADRFDYDQLVPASEQ